MGHLLTRFLGKLVARICSDNLKKVTLELGGNCPVLIFDDANIEQAISQVFALKFRHAGQACITANRIYVQSGIFDKFLERWNAEAQKIVVGHGADEKTTMGPVTTPRGVEKAVALVEDAKKKGAKIHTGGKKVEKNGGYFFEPTVITGVTADMDIAREEMFAPISTFIKFETEEEAVKAANDTSMGLASYLFTKNVDRMWRLFENLEAGMIGLNTGKLILMKVNRTKLTSLQATLRQLNRRSEASSRVGMARSQGKTWRSMST